MEKEYLQSLKIKGYRAKGDITNPDDLHLIEGSRDCVITKNEKVSSRKGFTLVGAEKTKNKGHKSSYDWETNRNFTRSVRLNNAGELEAYYVPMSGTGAWNLLKAFDANSLANFAPWWDETTELIDMLLFVVGDANVQMWSGGIAELASNTASTVTLKGYVTGTGIAFVEGGASDDTITDTGNGFVAAGFVADDEIVISGSVSNDGTYTIKSVVAGTITLYPDDDLANEAAGATVIAMKPNATWADQGFLTAGTRKVRIDDIEYAYTGGESTGTLTGLTGVPSLSAGDIVMQAIRTSSPADLAGLENDLISVYNNHVFYGSLTSRTIYISTSTDYTDFSVTSPLRAPGEGEELQLDATPTAFVPDGGPNTMYISGRKDSWYKVAFTMSADLSDESVTIEKIPSSTGQAAVNQGSIIKIKNATAFLSFEPAIDTLGRLLAIDTPTSLPISDDIRDDLLGYDLANANGIFYQNQIFITFPTEGIVIIYDTEQQIWQPPHYLPIGRFALVDIDGDGTQVLCGHSSVGNETYKLYDEYSDNGAPLDVQMHFSYEDYGTRFTQKSLDEMATELYMSENTDVTSRVLYDYKGSTEIKEFTIHGDGSDDETIFKPSSDAGIGSSPHGSNPLGSLATEVDDLSKVRVIDTTSLLDFFERQRVFKATGIDIRFAVVAFGENTEASTNIATHLKR